MVPILGPFSQEEGPRSHGAPGALCRRSEGSVTDRVGGDEPARGGAHAGAPAGTIARGHRGVEPQPGDDHVGVTGIRVDRDPGSPAALAPPHVAGGRQRAGDEAAAAQREADGPGTVIAGVEESGVTAAVAVRLVTDPVGPVDDPLDPGRSGGRGDRLAVDETGFLERLALLSGRDGEPAAGDLPAPGGE